MYHGLTFDKLIEDAKIAVLKHLTFDDLYNTVRLNKSFRAAAKYAANANFKFFKITHDRFIWLRTNFECFCYLLKDAVKSLELEVDAGDYPEAQLYDSMARTLISRCSKLETLRLIHLPSQLGPFPWATISTIKTLTFVNRENLTNAYPFLHNFQYLQNLNFFREDSHARDRMANITILTNWLQNNVVTSSIWLPEQFSDDLGIIRGDVRTIRIHVDEDGRLRYSSNGRLRNLSSLIYLTSIRIECCPDSMPTTKQAVTLLNEFGNLHAQQLKQLHLCCNFTQCSLQELLKMFINLELLIIVHYESNHRSYQPEDTVFDYTELAKNLNWPEHLTKLKCQKFKMTLDDLIGLVGKESLTELDIYSCIVRHSISDFSSYRSYSLQPMNMLLNARNAREMRPASSKYFYQDTSVRLLNMNHETFDVERGLGISIQFVGLEEPRYWHTLNPILNPKNIGYRTGYYLYPY